MDLQLLIFMFPAGVILCFRELRDEHVFVIIYAVMASYFAGVMVRLMLTLTPVVCVSAAVAFSSLFDTYIDPAEPTVSQEVGASETNTASSATAPPATSKKAKKAAAAAAHTSSSALGDLVSSVTGSSGKKGNKGIFGLDTRLIVVFNALCMLLFFVFHCTWVTATAYSSPSVVLASHNRDGSQNIIDDFREAYYWLRQNTPEDSVVMSWWDYGYQIAGMADRPTLVDNNTWNNSEAAVPLYHLYKLLTVVCKPTSQQLAKPCPVRKK
jgi:dolichyl-diphosphooligosaccharide---protein glycosyltransferase